MTTQIDGQLEEENVGGIWARLQQFLEISQYRPTTIARVEISQLSGKQGPYYIVKNTEQKTYYRLNEQDYFLWTQMDGSRSVKDLVVAYFMQYGSFAFARVGSLVQELKERSFLTDRPTRVYRQIEAALSRQKNTQRLQESLRIFTGKTLALDNIDRPLEGIYRHGGWVLFTKPAQIIFLIVIVLGVILFTQAFLSGKYAVILPGGSAVTGIILLMVLSSVHIFFHELGHGLTVKHFGREVRSGGFLLYYGMPTFFVDTTDIWMQHKKARLAVTWGGLHSSLVQASLAAILMVLSPWPLLGNLLYIFAFVTFIGVFFNLNPLLELDGYYLLMDWLEIPMLRAKSMGFVRTGLWSRLQHQAEESNSRFKTFFSKTFWLDLNQEEKLFAGFGILSLTWSVVAIGLSVYFWQRRLAGPLVRMWDGGNTLTRALILIAGLIVVALLAIVMMRAARPYLRRLFIWVGQRGLLNSIWRIAMLLLVGSALLAWMPYLIPQPYVAYVMGIAALIIAAVWAWQNGETIRGAHQAPAFQLLTLFSLLAILAIAIEVFSQFFSDTNALTQILPLITAGALLAALLASLTVLRAEGVRSLSRWYLVALFLGVMFAVVVASWASDLLSLRMSAGWLQFALVLLPLLSASLLIPTLISTWRTDFAPAWMFLMISLALLAFGVTNSSSLMALASLLLVTAMILYRTAFHRVDVRSVYTGTGQPSTDRALLTQAVTWTFDGLIVQHRALAGSHRSMRLITRFNQYSATANWMISIEDGQLESSIPPEVSLAERGRLFAAALSLYLDLMQSDIGQKTVDLALRRAYDTLSWEQRELSAIYIFSQVEQARGLSTQLQSTRSASVDLLRQMPVLSAMSNDEIELLASRLTSRYLPAGEVFIRQGDVGDNLYIIRNGLVGVSVQDESGFAQTVAKLGRGSYVGETALLYDTPRNATCTAVLPTEVLVLNREDFTALAKEHFNMLATVSQSLQVTELLRQIPVFAEVDGKTLQQIAALLETREFEAGAYLMRQGEIGNTFYVIASGQVEITITQNGEEKVVNQLGAGAYVGEIALLMNVPRTASVRALTPTTTYEMFREEFERLVTNDLYAHKVLELETSRRLHNQQRLAAPISA